MTRAEPARQLARTRHPIFARLYVLVSQRAMARGTATHRRELLAGLAGRLIEIGAGNGLNFAFYSPTVTEVVALEPEAHLRDRAAAAARNAPVPVRVIDGVAEQIEANAGSFDAGVSSLVLCSIRDPDTALRELFRVIRPGGELRFYEHVRAATPRLRRVQAIADALFWPRVAGGCHSARDTRSAVERAGFVIERCREFAFRPLPLLFLVAPHVIGIARRP
jgi:SAM-dependent methyltransferase